MEEIAEKLDMLKSYDDQIAGIKAAYNNEQMFHILDEAREMGEILSGSQKKPLHCPAFPDAPSFLPYFSAHNRGRHAGEDCGEPGFLYRNLY